MGGPSTVFLWRYNLDEHSEPADWFNALMPITLGDNKECLNKIDIKGDRKTKFAVSNWASHTASKVSIANAGDEGHILVGKYNKHKPLSLQDICQVIGTLIIDGLCPLLQLKKKMVL